MLVERWRSVLEFLIYIHYLCTELNPGRRQGTCPAQDVCYLEKRKKPSAFRRNAQYLGTVYVGPGSNRNIPRSQSAAPRNLLDPANHELWSVELVTHPDYSSV